MIDTRKHFQLQTGVFLKRPDVVTFDDKQMLFPIKLSIVLSNTLGYSFFHTGCEFNSTVSFGQSKRLVANELLTTC